jgi:hypothetical protein
VVIAVSSQTGESPEETGWEQQGGSRKDAGAPVLASAPFIYSVPFDGQAPACLQNGGGNDRLAAIGR